MQRTWMISVVMFLALALAACGGSKPAAAPASGKAPAGAPAGAPAAAPAAKTSLAEASAPEAASDAAKAPAAAAENSDAAEPTVAPAADDTLSLSSRDAGLDKLKSYRMRWQAQWQATDSGKADSSNWDWTEEYSSDPQALHWIWKVTDTTSDKGPQSFELWQTGNASYMSTVDDQGKPSCISFSSDDKSQQITKGLFSPSMLGSLEGARFVGNDTVNSIKAKHYKYDEKSAGLLGFGKASGETWVAADGGFVVKDVLSWEGAAGFFGSGSKANGKGEWTWELSNVNQALEIKPPEGCGGAANDLPILPDASDKGSFGDTITYASATRLADAVAFYQKEMPAAGWQASGEPQITEQLGMLEFGKGGQKAQVMISADQGKTQVMINVTKSE